VGLRAVALGVLLAMGASAAHADCPPRSTLATHVLGGGLCLVANTFGLAQAGSSPVLVVVVHGDISDGGRATYHAAFAQSIARPGVVAVALMRPGYTDADGRVSEGYTLGREDNYTAEAVTAIGGAIDALKKHYRASRVVYVGHSGGAAIGGVLIGRRPRLIDTALLISCPCDIAAWLRGRGRPAWRRSLSPTDFVHRVAASTEVIALTGADDHNTPPGVAQDYVGRLARHGIRARFILAAGAGHGFSGLQEPAAAALDAILTP
jgi:dienelactone hydrolase